ncbi:MAG: WD40/YVTN/BNR-like repeat-containing protein [Acidimicrobiales bacterium]
MASFADLPPSTTTSSRPVTHPVTGRCRARARVHPRHRLLVVALGALLALAAAACSSSSPSSSPDGGGSTPTSPASSDSSTGAGGSGTPVPTGFEPASVTFVSADQGVVLGTSSCSSPPCTAMAATDDGGATWHGLAAPAALLAASLRDPSSADAPGAVSEVRFGSHLDGWVFGPALWSTHDGGEHWAEQHLDGTVTDLASADGVAYAVVTTCPSGACEQGASLYRTDAGVDDWQVVDGVSLPAEGGQIELHGRAAWFVGPASSDGGGATFLSSPDGATWTSHDDPCSADDAFLDSVAPVDTDNLFLLCVDDPGAGSQGKSVRVSTDAGATTTAKGSPPRGGIAAEIAAADSSSVAVTAQSGASFIYRSGDGAETWTTVDELPDGGAGFRDLGFTTSTQGVVISGEPVDTTTETDAPAPGSQLLMTRDAGATWTPVSFS